MASFQVKIGWKRPRKREYKNYQYIVLTRRVIEISKKIAKKYKKKN